MKRIRTVFMTQIKYLNEIEKKAVVKFVNSITKKFNNNLEKIIMFGSKVRGDFNQDSDIDLLVVTNTRNVFRAISDEAFEILLKYGVYLSLKMMEISHFEKINEAMTGFSQSINNEGIVLWQK